MSESKLYEMISESVRVLNRVTADLIKGVEEKSLFRRYEGEWIIGRTTIQQYLARLRSRNCLRYEGNKVFLRDDCNPLKLLGIT
jgi:hypothetical protein